MAVALVRAAVIVITLGLCSVVQASLYNFMIIAETGATFTSFGGWASINSLGDVAFQGQNSFDRSLAGVFWGSGSSLTTIATEDDFNGFRQPVVIDNGDVAFFGAITPGGKGGQGIFVGNGGPLATIASNSEPTIRRFNGGPSFSNAGTVVIAATLEPSDGGGILSGNGGPLNLLYVTRHADPSSIYDGLVYPDVNSAGDVLFLSRLFHGGGPDVLAIGPGNAPVTVASTGTFFRTLYNSSVEIFMPSINDNDDVIFWADLVGGGTGIFTWNSGQITTVVADNAGPFYRPHSPSLNNHGQVAFYSDLDAGPSGVFTGSDPVADKVLAIGDALFGSTVNNIQLRRDGLNDNGQIALRVTLSDSREMVVRADPFAGSPPDASVPEPSSLFMWLMLGFLATVWTWQKHSYTRDPF